MKMLADSNILLRIAHKADPQHQLTMDSIAKLLHNKDDLCIVPQNIYEFWTVATRPKAVNGLGFPVPQVEQNIARLKHDFIFLDETPSVFLNWEKLVKLHAIVGKNAHDAHLVAAMTVHGITHLLTFNKQD